MLNKLSISSLYQWLNKRSKLQIKKMLHLKSTSLPRSLRALNTYTSTWNCIEIVDNMAQWQRWNNSTSNEKKLIIIIIVVVVVKSLRRFAVWLFSFIEPYWVVRRHCAGKEQKWQKRDNVFVWSKKMRIIMWSSIVHHTLIWLEKWFWLGKEQHSRGMNTRRKRNQQQQNKMKRKKTQQK